MLRTMKKIRNNYQQNREEAEGKSELEAQRELGFSFQREESSPSFQDREEREEAIEAEIEWQKTRTQCQQKWKLKFFKAEMNRGFAFEVVGRA
ncbi:hypothetical protein MRB53_023199 [Persea americana]|uniref:Uncharacterized protein n=1 Tax=Persea americana TaxID=3435 RepID=A0ACC2L8Q4_PERAE|nr:hypothetical protein MRB53_023199 [Persea americana]